MFHERRVKITMNQIEIINEIKSLCISAEYDKAIELTNKLKDRKISLTAHLLCIEHEHSKIKEKHHD